MAAVMTPAGDLVRLLEASEEEVVPVAAGRVALMGRAAEAVAGVVVPLTKRVFCAGCRREPTPEVSSPMSFSRWIRKQHLSLSKTSLYKI
jgi:hypothetical protein